MEEPESEIPHSTPESWLPDIDELFEAVEQEFAQVRSAAYVPGDASPGVPDADPSAPYVRAAAVLNIFDPKTLKPLAEPGAEAPESLAPSSAGEVAPATTPVQASVCGHSNLVVDARGEVRYCLRDEVRRAALAELFAAGRIGDALEANAEQVFATADPVQRVLVAALGAWQGRSLDLAELRLEELTALQQVLPWVEGLPLTLPPAREIRRRLERERLLDPFRRLIGRWDAGQYVAGGDGRRVWRPGAFVEYFRGRKTELRRLREHVDVVQAESLSEGASRGASAAFSYIFNLHERPPLVVHGPGGVGKSTLMAKFLLQHAEAHEAERFPFVYIDFDRPDILSLDTGAEGEVSVDLFLLLAEAARQLAVQYPEAEAPLLELQRRLQEDPARGAGVEPEPYVAELEVIHSQYMEPYKPLLLVLDTFEEVQERGGKEVAEMFDLLAALQGRFPRLRVVLAGRAPVTRRESGYKLNAVPLPDLGEEAARGFLLSHGVEDEREAAEIIALAGRHPLALKLAADLVRDSGIEEVRESAGGAGVVARFRRAWMKTDISGRLYHRLLNHVPDPEVRKLAHPGLVLRFITPDIIRRVLAGPCGVKVEDAADARRLFERLRQQVSLVAPASRDVLRHRPDVRRIMLPLILEDKNEQARSIQEGAVAFYAEQEGTAARAEEVYHRLMLGQPRGEVEARWVEGLKAHLRPALDELPPRGQAFVAARTGVERPDEVWQAADVEDWELYAEQTARALLKRRNGATRADQLLKQRPERSPLSRLYAIEAIVYSTVNQGAAARDRALELYRRAGVHPDLVEELEALSVAPEGGAQGLFSPGELKQLADVVMSVNPPYTAQLRHTLFLVMVNVMTSIPVAEPGRAQLDRDLLYLNLRGRQRDVPHPMVRWLERYLRYAKAGPQQQKFINDMLKKARSREASTQTK